MRALWAEGLEESQGGWVLKQASWACVQWAPGGTAPWDPRLEATGLLLWVEPHTRRTLFGGNSEEGTAVPKSVRGPPHYWMAALSTSLPFTRAGLEARGHLLGAQQIHWWLQGGN